MRRHRALSLFLTLAVLASACGGTDGQGGDQAAVWNVETGDPTATPAPTPAVSDESVPEATTVPDDEVTDEPDGAPATGLPILTEHVFDEVVYSMTSVDGYVVAATGTGLVRLDVDTGEQVRVHIATPDDPRLEPFWTAAGDHHVLLAADRSHEGAIDALTAVDVRTMQVVARLDDAAGVGPEPTGARDGAAIITSFATGPRCSSRRRHSNRTRAGPRRPTAEC